MSHSIPHSLKVLDQYCLDFTKMHGAGNDFILVDNREGQFLNDPKQVAKLCDRHRGVGADGLILLENTGRLDVPFRMRYYNSDGSEADMCGNGARCFAMFANLQAGPIQNFRFETKAGIVSARLHENLVTIGITPPHHLHLNNEMTVDGHDLLIHSINTGVPHAVVPVQDLEHFPVTKLGRAVRQHIFFQPEGTNVNFVEQDNHSRNHLSIRTYERGVEAETQACGTGMVASALVFAKFADLGSPIKVTVKGGETLLVEFNRHGDIFEDVRLTGPAEFVFNGQVYLPTEIQP